MRTTVTHLASALGVAIPAAFIASFPAAVRCSASATSTVGLVSAWPALAGLLVVPMALSIVLSRGARVGLTELAAGSHLLAASSAPTASHDAESDDVAVDSLGVPVVADEHVPARASLLLAAYVGWGALVCAGLAPLGAVLRARTHHHGLAGVTFAVLGVMYAFGAALAVRRALELVAATAPRTQRITLGVFWSGLGLAVLLLGAVGGLHSAAPDTTAATSASALVVDLFAFVLAAAFASRPLQAPRLETTFAWGSALALALVVIGIGSLGRVPGLEEELTRTSPFFALTAAPPAAPAPATSAD